VGGHYVIQSLILSFALYKNPPLAKTALLGGNFKAFSKI
jgi:hypothetical protein